MQVVLLRMRLVLDLLQLRPNALDLGAQSLHLELVRPRLGDLRVS